MPGGAADGLYTYDLSLADGGPRVPDVTDLGGTDIVDGDPPPQKGAQRHAGMDNVQTATLAGLCRMTWTARLSVEWTGSAYVVVALDAMGTIPKASDFGFAPQATGDVIVSWTPGTLPPQSRKPHVWCPDSHHHGYGASGSNQVEVFLVDLAGTAADVNFVLEIFG